MPFAELGELPAAVAERTRLEQRRLEAVEALGDAQLALGQHARMVARICRRLDGMPLGNGAGGRPAPQRHHTLQAAIDWSHELLPVAEQVLFRRLSAFHGGFDLETAQQVDSADPLSPRQILTPLPELVDRSLVVTEEAGQRACWDADTQAPSRWSP